MSTYSDRYKLELQATGANANTWGNNTNTNLETHSIQENSILEMIDEITQDIPESELEQLPTDFSKNLDHYLYGLPKVEE